ncbi:glycosyltransferase family 2 protein, partial [Cognatishimia maritima]
MSSQNDPIQTIANSALFDADTYAAAHPDVALSGLSPAEHYLRLGARLGRNPGPDFDSVAYLKVYKDVAAREENPLWHYETHGRGEGRSPKPEPFAPPQGQTRVDIVVPVYNALDDVQACLKSLADARNGYPLRALVINDGSDTATTQWLREACAALGTPMATFDLIEHPENRGYTKAVNTGLKASNAPYVVTLNSDTIVTDYWLDGLIRCMRSDPQIGVVGPLSNAASWQNVPDLFGEDGKFAINALPGGVTPNDMADLVRRVSKKSYPRSPFVNGFCFMIRQDVLAAVGYMDEIAFPIGYGEENDFCVRVQDAGFSLAFADDTYVFHAKSKSFGSANKEKLSKAGGQAIRDKHGADKFSTLVKQVAQTDQMDEVRAPIKAALNRRNLSAAAGAVDWVTTQRVLFVLPVRGGGGGAHSVVQEVAAMRALGVVAKVAIRAADLDDFMRLYGDIENAHELFAPFTDGTLAYVAKEYDVLVATIFTSVRLVARVVEQLPWILPAYYAQDYEPMFFPEGDALWREAYDSYTAIPD